MYFLTNKNPYKRSLSSQRHTVCIYVNHPYKRVQMSQYTKAVKSVRPGVLGHKYNIQVFSSIGQNYFTAFYVSKYCFAYFYILLF